MVPSNPVDLSAMLLAFSIPYAYFHSKVGEKLVTRPAVFRNFVLELAAILLLLLANWQLAANLIIWLMVIVALREF